MSEWGGELNGELWEVGHDDYHSDRTRDSSSTLKTARQSLQLYESQYIKGDIRREGSPEMLFGTAFHCALLEPKLFAQRYKYEPSTIEGEPINKRLKMHRQYLADFTAGLDGMVALSAGDQERIEGMLASVQSCRAAVDLLRSGRPELGVKFEIDGYPLKALIDWSCEDRNVVLDLKTTRHTGPRETFQREIDSREYHCQASLYCEAFRRLYGDLPDFYWVFVHTAPPYETHVFRMGQSTRKIGLEITRETIETLKVAKALDHFKPAKYGVATEIELPDWTLRKYGRADEVGGGFSI